MISHFLAVAEAVRGMAEAVKGLFYRLCCNSVKCLKFSDKWSEIFGTCTKRNIKDPLSFDSGLFLF